MCSCRSPRATWSSARWRFSLCTRASAAARSCRSCLCLSACFALSAAPHAASDSACRSARALDTASYPSPVIGLTPGVGRAAAGAAPLGGVPRYCGSSARAAGAESGRLPLGRARSCLRFFAPFSSRPPRAPLHSLAPGGLKGATRPPAPTSSFHFPATWTLLGAVLGRIIMPTQGINSCVVQVWAIRRQPSCDGQCRVYVRLQRRGVQGRGTR
mmetsp:Transcript_34672/g.109497  ORF Transcript_34672/g.109497 Transcript_34672/m.109497 type:complete len:214 (-) Transcript_34672:91-732(-)